MTAATLARPELPQTGIGQKPQTTAAPKRRRRGFATAAVLATFALVGAFFGLAAFHSVLVQGQYEVTLINEKTEVREVELLQLQLDVAVLRSPDRIRSEAVLNLGLVEAGRTTYLAPSNEAVAEVAAAALPMPSDEDERSDS
ncbi:MAG: hypothetical protein ACC652_04115 [Acidimicrobiales bacterium]